ncbi:hypothetical protein [Pectinatus frisingensis]|uniref:hypothetical protein n=1 Tax=Pectinatus frisingensis TaxID=865 RepID=UPI0018C60A3D|nr:hypothetical protein [Pectinatus frisingensis]
MSDYLSFLKLKELDINDPFFDSLKADYPKFEKWFSEKGDRTALVQINDGKLNGLLVYKMESGSIDGANPPIRANKIFKIATFKINAHGTKLGERFVKKSLDLAIINNADICYLTAFPKQDTLLMLFQKYGFYDVALNDRNEHIFVKNLRGYLANDVYLDYPRINASSNTNKYLLGIYPQFHSKMFPDSILHNESVNILDDVSYTNSITKIYICKMSQVGIVKPSDIFLIYRTGDGIRPARYSAVVTSVCTVEACKKKNEFPNFTTFYDYCRKHSIFSKNYLEKYYMDNNQFFVIKMVYNAAFSRRIINGDLIDKFGIKGYWGFMKLTDSQFINIIKAGGVFENLIVH